MNLASDLTSVKKAGNLPLVERADICCGAAKQLEKAGEYEQAQEALAEFWAGLDETPKLDGLDSARAARVLMRAGALAGWLGSTRQANGGQDTAKDLLSQSIRLFEELGDVQGVAEARADLALCYWREGAFDEAEINLAAALKRLDDVEDNDLKAVVLVRRALVEMTAGQMNEALRTYETSAPLVERSDDNALKGSFHNGLGTLLNSMGLAESREDYIDQSLLEFAAASFHFEQAGHIRHQACVDINLAFLFFTLSRFAEAHKYLDRARNVLIELGDQVHLAQVNDTRARTLLAEGRVDDAERFARSAVKTLEKGDEQALLAEALTTYGQVLSRSGKQPSARLQIQRAIKVAEAAGDLEGAGRAQLTLMEELGDQTSAEELASIYRSAIDLLKGSQDPSTRKRLTSCAEKLLDAFAALESGDREPKEHTWEGFSFKRYVHEGERTVIERALRDAGGSVTRAARLLGFRHHQSLISLINSRHKELLKTRSTVRRRRQHIFSKPKRVGMQPRKRSPKRRTSQVSVLHVEDHQMVAKLVGDILAAEDWRVELCMDGDTALRKLTGNDHYDVLVIDNSLPGLSGLELVQRARKITHRRRTPIIILSGDDIEKEAWRAGADEFLRKPDAVARLVSTITRLVGEVALKKD